MVLRRPESQLDGALVSTKTHKGHLCKEQAGHGIRQKEPIVNEQCSTKEEVYKTSSPRNPGQGLKAGNRFLNVQVRAWMQGSKKMAWLLILGEKEFKRQISML